LKSLFFRLFWCTNFFPFCFPCAIFTFAFPPPLDNRKLHKQLSNSCHRSGKRYVWQLNGFVKFLARAGYYFLIDIWSWEFFPHILMVGLANFSPRKTFLFGSTPVINNDRARSLISSLASFNGKVQIHVNVTYEIIKWIKVYDWKCIYWSIVSTHI
jgi:hypothetical protein